MKKNLIISLSVVGAIILGSATVFAGNAIANKVTCPNCGTEVEVQAKAPAGRFGRMQFGKNFESKTLDELKAELAAQVAEGKIAQEQADKRIESYEKWQENAKKREEEQAKRKEEYKAKLAEKVAAGEMTQEQADKLLENYGKRGNRENKGNKGGFNRPGNFDKKAEPKTLDELKNELAAQVAEGKITQEQADKRIESYEKWQENAQKMKEAQEKRKAEQEKRKEEYKAELAAKVAAGEMTQEQADKLLENYGKRGFFRGNFKVKTLEEYKAELAAKVTAGEMTQEEADKLIAEYEARQAKFKEFAEKKGEGNKEGKAPFGGQFGGRFGGRGRGGFPGKAGK